MLQHTVDRADCLAVPEQRVTVMGADHEEEATRQLQQRGGRLVLQPGNRDTAAEVYLPLTYVRAADSDETAAIYPSDHFIHPEEEFIEAVHHAVSGSAFSLRGAAAFVPRAHRGLGPGTG
ncbi:MAG: hypothetical protein ABI604_05850, partial [Nitrospirota bacterium]